MIDNNKKKITPKKRIPDDNAQRMEIGRAHV